MAATIQIDGVTLRHKTVAFGATVSLANGTPVGDSQRWELLDYPTDLADANPDFATNFSSFSAVGDGTYIVSQPSSPFAAVTFKGDITGTYILRLTSVEGSSEHTDTCVISIAEAHTGEELQAAGEDNERDARAGYKKIANKRMKRLGKRMQGYIRVVNVSGSSIARGKVVKLASAQDAHTVTPNSDPGGSVSSPEKLYTITVADNTAAGAGTFDYAVLDETVANNAFGWAQKFGLFEGKTDVDYTGFAVGSWVYFNSTGVQVGTPPGTGIVIPIGTLLQTGSTGSLSIGLAAVRFANTDGSLVTSADQMKVGILATDAQHGSRGGAALHAVATGSAHGFMSSTDKAAFDALNILTTKGDLLTRTTVYARLGIGSDGQVLTADAASGPGMKWAAIATDVLTTKGDILSRSSSAYGRLGVGSDGQVLTADAASTFGVKWAAGAAAGAQISGTPVANQIAVWTSATQIKGITGLTFDGTLLKVTAPANTLGTISGHFEANDTWLNGIKIANPDGRDWSLFSTGSAYSGGANHFALYDGTAAAVRLTVNSSGNLGVGTESPTSLLSVGASSVFQVNSSGDLVKIRNVTYTWPSSQGAAGSTLANDGSGGLSWSAAGVTGSGTSGNLAYFSGTSTLAGSNNWSLGGAPNSIVVTLITDQSPGFQIASRTGSTANSIKFTGSFQDVYLFGTQGVNQEISGTAAGDFGFRAFADKKFWVGPGFTYDMATRVVSTKIVSIDGTSSASYFEAAAGDSASVSGANKGRLIYNVGAQKWQISENTNAYVDLVNAAGSNVGGAGAVDRLAIWASGSALTSTAGLTYTGGNLQSLVPAVATGTDKAYLATNTTAAAAGAQQYSPVLSLVGQGWKTTATAASQSVEFAVQTRPIQGTGSPTGEFHILSQINGGGYSSAWKVNSAGTVTTTIDGVGVTSVAGQIFRNTTAAAAGAQQQAPTVSLIGQGWKTDATAASQQVEFRLRLLPVEGTSAPTANFSLQSCINDDGVYTTQFVVTSDGLTQVASFKHTGSLFSVFGAVGVGQQTRGATLTNNVTSGGTDDVIDDITDVATYSNAGAGAAIRNALYQLARAQRQHDVALRNLGFLS